MAGDHASGAGEGPDFAEHLKTYEGFLFTLKISAGVTAAVLLAMFLLLAR